MTDPNTDLLPEREPSLLEQAYLILARQTMMLPTVQHLEALDAMHLARYERLLEDIQEVEERYRHLEEGLTEVSGLLETIKQNRL